jgi:hypothetical protein
VPVVVEASVIAPYKLKVVFRDGRRRTVDLTTLLHGPVFEPLRDPNEFAKATVDAELGTVVWPNGADLAPEFLYEGAEHAEPSAT